MDNGQWTMDNEQRTTDNDGQIQSVCPFSIFHCQLTYMKERFVVEGGRRLEGTIRPGGNKNAALPILAACLLTDDAVVLRNLPDIQDVRVMLQILEGIGATVDRIE